MSNISVEFGLRNETLSNRTGPLPCPTITPAEWMATQLPTLAFGTAITSTQLFNFLIFALWRNKEPYILLHVSLAVASLLAGVTVVTAVPLRYAPYTAVNIFLNLSIGVCLLIYANTAAILTNFAISVDRWMSVEFPIKYRTSITHRKTLLFGSLLIFGGSLVMTIPGFILFWKDMNYARCTGLRTFSPKGVVFTIWEALKGPIFFPLLFMSQLRILMIAVGQRLLRVRRRRTAVQVVPAGNAPAQEILRIVWSSFLGSMAVVFCTLISHVPNYFMSIVPNHASATIRRLGVYLTLLQHCVSPVIYLLFWPPYRQAVSRLFGQLRAAVTPEPSVETRSTRKRHSLAVKTSSLDRKRTNARA
ncbi:hypothetical protein BV898_14911 [Hypsibius exemplaris]|uniref:G-protein coupled receptors family 1 profile domain-containing protein n=1 Tax=Hypsibius exemplaris TaxID=2072580 RepID=A0A9X6RJX1_HYPEX|nr:hypothetical protein BV898_14911 [Hypsibius exemplaris]